MVRGRSSEVERQLPKLNVVGSIPIARSISTRLNDESGMSVAVDQGSAEEAGRANRLGFWLVGSAVGLLVAAGLLLWGRHGEAVFGDTVIAALAWCF